MSRRRSTIAGRRAESRLRRRDRRPRASSRSRIWLAVDLGRLVRRSAGLFYRGLSHWRAAASTPSPRRSREANVRSVCRRRPSSRCSPRAARGVARRRAGATERLGLGRQRRTSVAHVPVEKAIETRRRRRRLPDFRGRRAEAPAAMTTPHALPAARALGRRWSALARGPAIAAVRRSAPARRAADAAVHDRARGSTSERDAAQALTSRELLEQVGFDQRLGEQLPLDLPSATRAASRFAWATSSARSRCSSPRLLPLPGALHRRSMRRHRGGAEGRPTSSRATIRGRLRQLRSRGHAGERGGEEAATVAALRQARERRRLALPHRRRGRRSTRAHRGGRVPLRLDPTIRPVRARQRRRRRHRRRPRWRATSTASTTRRGPEARALRGRRGKIGGLVDEADAALFPLRRRARQVHRRDALLDQSRRDGDPRRTHLLDGLDVAQRASSGTRRRRRSRIGHELSASFLPGAGLGLRQRSRPPDPLAGRHEHLLHRAHRRHGDLLRDQVPPQTRDQVGSNFQNRRCSRSPGR